MAGEHDDKHDEEEDQNIDPTTSEDEEEQQQDDEQEEESVEELKARLAELEKADQSRAELLKKVRKFEKENKERAIAEAKAKEDFKNLYEQEHAERTQLENQLQNFNVEEAINRELGKIKAKNSKVVRKLIDRSKITVDEGVVDTNSIKSQLAEIKEETPELFDTPSGPTPRRSGDSSPDTIVRADRKNPKSRKELDELWAKYQKSKGL